MSAPKSPSHETSGGGACLSSPVRPSSHSSLLSSPTLPSSSPNTTTTATSTTAYETTASATTASPATTPALTAPSASTIANGTTFTPLPQSCFGLDIGGTLCKISYFEKGQHPLERPTDRAFKEKMQRLITSAEPYGETGKRDTELEFHDELLGGNVYLMRFETRKMESFLQMVREHMIVDESTAVCCTGGGSRKYDQPFKEALGITINKADELGSLVDGINFTLQRRMLELYRVDHLSFKDDGHRIFLEHTQSPFPYLLVNIGSGVSMLKVTESKHERVGGTSVGGATFFGLCCVLTGCSTFDEALELASRGDAKGADLLVSDIYGGGLEEHGLPGDVVAASFGKLTNPEVRSKAKPEDLARAMLDMVTNNVASLAMLHAQKHALPHVVFAGNFLRQNKISIARLSHAVHFWSGGERQALFLAHEGYLGALGAMLHVRASPV